MVALVLAAACSSNPSSASEAEARIAADYPRVDGSTSALPLQHTIACELYGLDCLWVSSPWDGTMRVWPVHQSSSVARSTNPADRKLAESTDFVEGMRHSGTHGSYVNLINGDADLILVARVPSADELAAADSAGVTLDVRPVALDAFVFLANTFGPVDGLRLETIRQIYAGSITQWNEAAFGAPPEPIVAYVRNENSGSQELMEQLVMGEIPMLPASPAMVLPSMGAPINQVRVEQYGIAYSVYFYAEHIHPDSSVTLLAIDGVRPTRGTIAYGWYPLTAEVYVAVRTDLPLDDTAILLRDWLLTSRGQEVVAMSGYVPLP